MSVAAATRSGPDDFEDGSLLGQTLDILRLLRSGGDERLALDPIARRDPHGCSDRPEPEAALFASSTASSVSQRSLDAARRGWRRLAASPERLPARLPTWFDAVRDRILKYCGAPEADCVLAASGTDAELIVLALAAGALRRPVTNIVLAPGETGRGVVVAAAGRHFHDGAPFAAVAAGARLAGWEHADIRVETVEIRDAAGATRAPAAVEGDARALARAAIAAGRGALLHLLDVSKTGREGLSLEAARSIAAEAPERTLVVADCCQLRCAPERLRALLDAGFLLTLSGSKFAGGPPFSGAAITPKGWLARFDASLLPSGLSAHAAELDWPPALRGALAGRAVARANVGLGLRWLAALAELERFAEIEPALARRVRARFRADVARSVEGCGRAALEPCDGDVARWPETIATLRLRRGDGSVASKAEAERLRVALREPLPGAGNVAARRFHVGQPVGVGEETALRICLSAPLINAVADRIDAGLSFDAAYAPLFADVAALFEKWRLLARRLESEETSDARLRAAA
jgi:hypothetical protein